MKLFRFRLVLRHDVTCDGILWRYKWTPAHNRVSFLLFSKRSVSLCVLFGIVCHKQYILSWRVDSLSSVCASLPKVFNRWVNTSAVCSLFGSVARPGSSRGSRSECCAPAWLRLMRLARLARPAVGVLRQPRWHGCLECGARRWICQEGIWQSSSYSSNVLTPRAEAHPVSSSSRGRTRCLSCLILRN